MKVLSTILMVLSLSACSFLERRQQVNNETWQSYVNSQDYETEIQARQELGLSPQQALNRQQAALVHWRKELIRNEARLKSPSEIQQYYDYKPYFVNDQQRVHFLKKDNLEEKQAWLDKYIKTGSESYTPVVKEAISKQDIVPYMTKDAVMESWGRPDQIEVSGSSVYNNEKWLYTTFVSTEDGEVEENKYLYFENGQLVAWETQNN